MDRLIIFDTTLRDGEQSPGATMTAEEKLQIAIALDDMGVDVIEAGFALSSREDFESIVEISKHMKRATTCSLARATVEDIARAAESLAFTDNKRIHTFISTSDIHIKHKLRSTREEVLETIKKSVMYARSFTDNVEWSAEDATRTDHDYLCRCVEAAISAGATTINLPDTLGYTLPGEHFNFFKDIMTRVPNADKAIFSVHCHNDLGMATANSLAGIQGGARQVECTMNGLGERAGSAALEEIVMAAKVRRDLLNIDVNIDTVKLFKTAQMVAAASNFPIPKNKAVVGGNAFAHESGIHQDGLLKSRQTYEIMTPESVGVNKMNLVIGKHSGRNAFKKKLEEMGIECDDASFEKFFKDMKVLASKQKHISDADIRQICQVQETLYDKIFNAHIVAEADGTPLLYIDRHLIHEVTSPQAFEGLRAAGRKMHAPKRVLATADHNTPTKDLNKIVSPESKAQLDALTKNTAEFGVEFYPLGSERNGVIHVIGPEAGFTLPGATLVCGDSHTATHGAFGAVAFGIGTSEVEHVFATQTLPQKKMKNMRITVNGKLAKNVSAKDVILYIISKIGTAGGTGYAVEFAGDVFKNMSMEARMTVCNMAIEAGARVGLIAPDETTFAYLKHTPKAPKGAEWDTAVAYWKTLKSDDGAKFDKEYTFNAQDIKPMVTWGTSPEDGVSVDGVVPGGKPRALEYMGLKEGDKISEVKIDKVFIGSCTNGRIEDLHAAAEVLKGKHIAPWVSGIVVPGSNLVKKQAEQEGLDKIFTGAGLEWRHAGCSMCLAMNDDVLAPGERCVSTSNRNFEGRQGRDSRTHLASPRTAALSAIKGYITGD